MLISLLAALPLTAASCGGDKSPDQGTRSVTGPLAGAGGPTGASTGPTGGRPSTTSGSGGSAGPKGGSGGGATKQGSSGRAARRKGDRTSGSNGGGKKKPPKPKFAPGAFPGIQELYSQSKTVCHALTLDSLAREYLVKPKTPAAVARRYARAYPPSIRNAVYRGCKAGL